MSTLTEAAGLIGASTRRGSIALLCLQGIWFELMCDNSGCKSHSQTLTVNTPKTLKHRSSMTQPYGCKVVFENLLSKNTRRPQALNLNSQTLILNQVVLYLAVAARATAALVSTERPNHKRRNSLAISVAARTGIIIMINSIYIKLKYS